MKIKHILSSKDFVDIIKNGKKVKGGLFCLYSKKDGSFHNLSIGIVISKKFVPKAVTRNYIKRRIYACFRDLDRENGYSGQIVVRVIRNVDGLSKKGLSKAIKQELDGISPRF